VRVVVTGATGNVGTSLLRALAGEESVSSVVGIARRVPEGGGAEFPKVEWVAADVAADDLDPAFAGADAVVHLAWVIQPSHREDVLEAVNVGGTGRVLAAAARAGVRHVVYASSVGAYSPGPKDRAVDESWPTDGIPSSFYARHKAATERLLDRFEAEHPGVRVVRLRPGLIFKREAAAGIHRLFLGPLVPGPLLRPRWLKAVPRTPRLVFQAVHTTDVAEAYRLALVGDARGPFNIAADPVLDGRRLAATFEGWSVPVPQAALRLGAGLSWRLHLQPTPPGWVDLAYAVPVLDTARARREMGWRPRVSATDALVELLHGFADGAEGPTPALARHGRVGFRRERREVAAAAGSYRSR
jgi:nucleoside-diphosphate-sugar epimerase